MTRKSQWFKQANIAALAMIPLVILISGCTAASPAGSTTLGETSLPPANKLAFTIDPDSGIDFPSLEVIKGDSLVMLRGGVQKAASDLKVGDLVMAAGSDLQWATKKLTAVDIIDETGTSKLILVNYGQDKEIVLTPDSLLVRSDRALVPVNKLMPGDKLLGADGKMVEVNIVWLGEFDGGLVALSTGTPAGQGGTVLNINGLAVPESLFQP